MVDDVKGVVAILTDHEGYVIASMTDFDISGYGVYTMMEAQTLRVKRNLAYAVVQKMFHPLILDGLDAHHCEEIVQRLLRKGKATCTIIPMGYAT